MIRHCLTTGIVRYSDSTVHGGLTVIAFRFFLDDDPHATLERPLRSMDIFSGCGGLTLGLSQSGVAEAEWALENNPAAAVAFKKNNPSKF